MVTPAVGQVVLVRFPFSDLSQSKLRPAVCLAHAGRRDWLLRQITSKAYGDSLATAPPTRRQGASFVITAY
jgi:mRNA interferase MazF